MWQKHQPIRGMLWGLTQTETHWVELDWMETLSSCTCTVKQIFLKEQLFLWSFDWSDCNLVLKKCAIIPRSQFDGQVALLKMTSTDVLHYEIHRWLQNYCRSNLAKDRQDMARFNSIWEQQGPRCYIKVQNQSGLRWSSEFTVDVKNDGFRKARFRRLHNDLPPNLIRDFPNEAWTCGLVNQGRTRGSEPEFFKQSVVAWIYPFVIVEIVC